MSAPGSTPPAATPLRRLTATRYVTALREGGSVPAVVEADDGALYVAKFQAAAQGRRALAAELIAGEVGRAARLGPSGRARAPANMCCCRSPIAWPRRAREWARPWTTRG